MLPEILLLTAFYPHTGHSHSSDSNTVEKKNPINFPVPCAVFMLKTSDLTMLPSYHFINWADGMDITVGPHGPHEKLVRVLIGRKLPGGGGVHSDLCRTISGLS